MNALLPYFTVPPIDSRTCQAQTSAVVFACLRLKYNLKRRIAGHDKWAMSRGLSLKRAVYRDVIQPVAVTFDSILTVPSSDTPNFL